MQKSLGEYLFDTNCFYSIGNNQDKINQLKNSGFKITTAWVAVAEIARTPTNISEKKFNKRKLAMYALDKLADDIYILADYVIIPRAYGQHSNLTIDNSFWREQVLNFLNSNSPKEVDKVINQYLNKLKINWREHFVKGFKKVTDDGLLSEDDYREQIILGYACHSGLIHRDIYNSARARNDLEKLKRKAVENYNGDLDVLVDFLIKMVTNTPKGTTIEQNRVFDLEFLFYLRPNDTKQIFVTKEDDLIKLLGMVDKKRVKHSAQILTSGRASK